jgi:hypothetical protein
VVQGKIGIGVGTTRLSTLFLYGVNPTGSLGI